MTSLSSPFYLFFSNCTVKLRFCNNNDEKCCNLVEIMTRVITYKTPMVNCMLTTQNKKRGIQVSMHVSWKCKTRGVLQCSTQFLFPSLILSISSPKSNNHLLPSKHNSPFRIFELKKYLIHINLYTINFLE